MLLRILISAVLLVAAVLIPYRSGWRFLLFFPAYFVIGWDVLWKAVKNIAHGQIFDENFLMALATVGAFCTGFFGEGEYPEAVFVMLFYQVGELFQSYAVGRSRRSIAELMNIRPDYANIRQNGELVRVRRGGGRKLFLKHLRFNGRIPAQRGGAGRCCDQRLR